MTNPNYHTMNEGGQSRGQGHTTIYMGNPGFNGFDHKSIRANFVYKVYSIVAVQLAFTSLLIALFTFHAPTRAYFRTWGDVYLMVSLFLGLTVYLLLICVDSLRRSFPANFILLSLLTLSYGMIAAIYSSRFDTVTVLSAFGTTAGATLAIMLIAKYTSFDVTTCGCGLCILAMFHLLLSLMLIIILVPMGYATTASMIIAGLGAMLVSFYLLFDLQLIMGGRSAELSPEEYILGAVLIYIDIINLFQYMLILFSGRN